MKERPKLNIDSKNEVNYGPLIIYAQYISFLLLIAGFLVFVVIWYLQNSK